MILAAAIECALLFRLSIIQFSSRHQKLATLTNYKGPLSLGLSVCVRKSVKTIRKSLVGVRETTANVLLFFLRTLVVSLVVFVVVCLDYFKYHRPLSLGSFSFLVSIIIFPPNTLVI